METLPTARSASVFPAEPLSTKDCVPIKNDQDNANIRVYIAAMDRCQDRKISKVCQNIMDLGFKTDFQKTCSIGSNQCLVTKDIEDSDCFVVYISRQYCNRVYGGDISDIVKYEFDYCMNLHGVCKAIPIAVDGIMDDAGEFSSLISQFGEANIINLYKSDSSKTFETRLSTRIKNCARIPKSEIQPSCIINIADFENSKVYGWAVVQRIYF